MFVSTWTRSRSVAAFFVLAVFVIITAAAMARSVAATDSLPPRAAQPPSGEHQDSTHLHHRQGSIIGSETPEMIPDHVAIGLMLRFMAHAEASGDEGRMHVGLYFNEIERVSGITLTPTERSSLLSAASTYVAAAFVNGDRSEDRRRDAAESVWRELGGDLSQETLLGLQLFVDEHVKRRIKILK